MDKQLEWKKEKREGDREKEEICKIIWIKKRKERERRMMERKKEEGLFSRGRIL